MSPSQFRQSAHPQLQGCAQSHSWPAQVQLSAAGFSRVDMFRLLVGGVRERLSYLLTDEAMDHYTVLPRDAVGPYVRVQTTEAPYLGLVNRRSISIGVVSVESSSAAR